MKIKEAKWKFKVRLRSRYRAARQIQGQTVEIAWEELKEGILRLAVEVCGMSRKRSRIQRTVWWSTDLQDAVRAKKIAYESLLDQMWLRIKEAKSRVRKAKKNDRKSLERKWMSRGCKGGSGQG